MFSLGIQFAQSDNEVIVDDNSLRQTEERRDVVTSPHYFQPAYDSKERFISYWHQINEVIRLNLAPVLEIGIGNAFVAHYLKEKGISITTMDVDERLNPDRLGSVLAIPFSDGAFKVVSCFEVLEHLSYREFPKAISEIYRVSGEYAVLSLPDASVAHRVEIWVPKIGALRGLIHVPWKRPIMHEFDGEHHWEIGKRGYPLGRIIGEMKKAGFGLEITFRVFENPYHRFFRLKKILRGPSSS